MHQTDQQPDDDSTDTEVKSVLATATFEELFTELCARCDAFVFAAQVKAGPHYRSLHAGNVFLRLGLSQLLHSEMCKQAGSLANLATDGGQI